MEIPFHRPSIGREEIDEVIRTLESGWLTSGPRTAQLEKEFAAYVRANHALAVNSATAALHLALLAMDIRPGAEVITSPLTFCATVNVILHVGATPVLADVGADGNIDPACMGDRITHLTRAIIPVHLGGLPCDMDSIWALAHRYRLRVLEDAAHAVGSLYRGRPIGASGLDSGQGSDAVAFSFYATKNLTTGEGGIGAIADPEIAEKFKLLSFHGISHDAWSRHSDQGGWYYEVLAPGFKYNLSDLHSAMGLQQLRKLEQFIATRRRYADLYNNAFAGCEEFELPPDRSDCRHNWHLYTLRLNLHKLAISRDEFIELLRERGIGTSVHFIPIPLHPFFARFKDRPENYCPKALALYRRLVSLPLYPAMSEEQVQYVATAAKEIARGARKHKSVPGSNIAE
jgi:dTDP-4-amino-4,6-dideoxygalactose transaminase